MSTDNELITSSEYVVNDIDQDNNWTEEDEYDWETTDFNYFMNVCQMYKEIRNNTNNIPSYIDTSNTVDRAAIAFCINESTDKDDIQTITCINDLFGYNVLDLDSIPYIQQSRSVKNSIVTKQMPVLQNVLYKSLESNQSTLREAENNADTKE